MSLPRAIRSRRKEKGWSQKDLGAMLRPPVGQGTVGWWENEDKPKFPSPEMLGQLAHLLDLDLNALLRAAPGDSEPVEASA